MSFSCVLEQRNTTQHTLFGQSLETVRKVSPESEAEPGKQTKWGAEALFGPPASSKAWSKDCSYPFSDSFSKLAF